MRKASCSREILGALGLISTSTISDALDKLKTKGAITGICPIYHGAKIVGPAFTVKEVARNTDIAEFRVTEALDRAESGSVMVFDVGGYQGASTWGGLASLCAKQKKIRGVVVNGAVRDVSEIRRIRFPVFARAVVPITGKGRIATISINTPIDIAGVQIKPNDFVVADENGIVVIPREEINGVLMIASQIIANEEKVKKGISRGRTTAELERELNVRI